ncbi:GH25 family lysozyme [Streptomyces megasporus]|uniref:GH25 family lysozyme n=1 Tax=Streptomyces megasporus TaxID=44060 RepID=UPI00068C6BF9|nr:GH25 family lysozyme [Streptomyces megasporus]
MRIPLTRLSARAVAVVATTAVALGLAGTAPAQAAYPSSYSVKGIDTSRWNHGSAINWNSVAASGQKFVFHKATQSTGWVDPYFVQDFKASAAAGLMNSGYHFYAEGTGSAQADHFIATLRGAGYTGKAAGQLPPVIDLEHHNGACPAYATTTHIGTFINKIKSAFGVTPIVYTSKWFVDDCLGGNGGVFATTPLWQPRYQSGSNEPAAIPGANRSWSFWQYSDTGSVSGISGNVDLNVFRGSLSELRAMANLGSGGGGGTQLPAWPVLKSGSTGVDVRALQYLLNARGYATTVDGSYGPATTSQVTAFQRANGLVADGITGPATWSKVIVTVQSGATGSAVKAVQTQLNSKGYSLAVDGSFGPATLSAVKSFQSSKGLAVDGSVGPMTWQALIGS